MTAGHADAPGQRRGDRRRLDISSRHANPELTAYGAVKAFALNGITETAAVT